MRMQSLKTLSDRSHYIVSNNLVMFAVILVKNVIINLNKGRNLRHYSSVSNYLVTIVYIERLGGLSICNTILLENET